MQRTSLWRLVPVAAIFLLVAPAAFAGSPSASEVDDFEDGTTENWIHGQSNPNEPTNVADGGPSGAGDNYLETSSSGGGGAGSRWAMLNRSQWTGDYTALGPAVTIQADVNNLTVLAPPIAGGAADANLRIGVQSTGGDQWVSTTPRVAVAGDGWLTFSFFLTEADMTQVTGTGTLNDTLSDVNEVRFISADSPSWIGDAVVLTVGFDNINVADVPVELQSFSID